MKHLFLRTPAHNCTPIIPKIKNTKKHNSKTFPNIGKVSSNNITSIRIPGKKTKENIHKYHITRSKHA